MKREILTIFIFCVCTQLVRAQTDGNIGIDSNQGANNNRFENVVYVELLGSGLIYSINYERRLWDQLWGRVGASYLSILGLTEGDLITIPLGVSYLLGGDTSFLELGLGTTILYADTDRDSFFSSEDEKGFGVLLNATIGYRLQPPDKNFFFKIAFTPVYSPSNNSVRPFAGIALGYSF